MLGPFVRRRILGGADPHQPVAGENDAGVAAVPRVDSLGRREREAQARGEDISQRMQFRCKCYIAKYCCGELFDPVRRCRLVDLCIAA